MRAVILFFTFLVAVGPVAAQSWPNKAFGGRQEVPVAIFMGDAPRGAKLEKQIEMRNIWKVPLEITKIKVSCGCTEVITPLFNETTKTPAKVLLPDEVASVTIKVDGTRYENPIQVTITVSGGPQTVANANLIVSANFRKDIALSPGELRFDSVKRGQTVERVLDVEYFGKAPWKLLGLAQGNKAPFDVKSEILPPRQNNGVPVVAYRVTARLKPDAPIGNFRETVHLKTTDPKQDVSFVVVGAVAAPVEVFPNPVAVVNLKVGVPTTTKVVIAASEPFKVTGITGNEKDISVVLPDGPAAITHILDIQVTPTTAGRMTREFVLQTSLRNETVRVVIQGNVN